ncbi:MAG: hypothetical protein DRJ34_02570 [Thermoprotei archaeon]|nr:MAG: hypothetical protein DRJ34_02570 [Thermoprotei archaeon]
MFYRILTYISIILISGLLLTYFSTKIYSVGGKEHLIEKSFQIKSCLDSLENRIIRNRFDIVEGFSKNINIYIIYNLGTFDFKMPITYIFIGRSPLHIDPPILSNNSFTDIYCNKTFIGVRSNIFFNKSGGNVVKINLIGIYLKDRISLRNIDMLKIFFNQSEVRVYSFTTDFFKIRIGDIEYNVAGLNRYLIYITIYRIELYGDR